MSAYNKNNLSNFIKAHVNELHNLNKFKSLSPDVSSEQNLNAYIDKMKLTPDELNTLIKMFRQVQIPVNNMFAHTESFCDRGNIKNTHLSIDKFWELTPDIFKGTMSFTSCWAENNPLWESKNLGKKFNISTNSTFLGKYLDCFGRILIYRNTSPLTMLDLGVSDLGGRKSFTYMITKLILGSDYNFKFTGVGIEPLPESCSKICRSDCTTGLWNHEGALDEKCWAYFMEYAFYNNTLTIPINGIILNDVSYDKLDEVYLSGTEFRVFGMDKNMILESILYRDYFYTNKEEYKNVLFKDLQTYDPEHPKLKEKDEISLKTINFMLNSYCLSRTTYKLSSNIFDRNADKTNSRDARFQVLKIPFLVFDNQQSGGSNYKYLKYKNKYLKLKNELEKI